LGVTVPATVEVTMPASETELSGKTVPDETAELSPDSSKARSADTEPRLIVTELPVIALSVLGVISPGEVDADKPVGVIEEFGTTVPFADVTD
jgi:hypothetical protein